MRFLPSTRSLGAFLAVQFVCGQAHELAHHLAARAACGAWGAMTFDFFFLPEGAAGRPEARWATFAGPALTYLLILLGGWLLRREPTRRMGLLLVFANLPLGRLAGVLTGHGDEMVLARAWLGGPWAWPLAAALALALLVPPLGAAFRSLARPGRLAAFAGLLVLPLPADLLIKRGLLAPLLAHLPGPSAFGLPAFLVAVDLASAVAAVLLLRPRGGSPGAADLARAGQGPGGKAAATRRPTSARAASRSAQDAPDSVR